MPDYLNLGNIYPNGTPTPYPIKSTVPPSELEMDIEEAQRKLTGAMSERIDTPPGFDARYTSKITIEREPGEHIKTIVHSLRVLADSLEQFV